MRKTIMLSLMAVLLCCLVKTASALTVSGTLKQISRNGETPLSDIAVVLEQEGGISFTARTGNNGEYRFNNVTPGTYRITSRLPQGHVAAAMGDNSRFLLSNDENVRTPWISLQEDTVIPLGTSRTTAGISIAAFVDSNENGGHMSTEPDLDDVTVEVYADGYEQEGTIASGSTNRRGELSLPGMSPGTYRLKAILPSGYMIGPIGSKVNIYYNCFRIQDNGEAWTDPITLEKGTQGMGVGAVEAGSASGVIFYDENRNGRMDAGESGFEAASVSVYSESQGFEQKTEVRKDGVYVFDPLQPGEYQFRVSLPEGYMFGTAESGSFLSSDYSGTDAAAVTVEKKNVTQIPQVAVVRASGISVQFYLDLNANGKMDADEKPYQGSVSVQSAGIEVLSIQTDETGVAKAPVVRQGEWTLTASVSSGSRGAIFTVKGEQNDFSSDSAQSAISLPVTLNEGEQKLLYAGITYAAQISGMLYLDVNGNGKMDPLEGTLSDFTVQTVNREGTVTAQTQTDRTGSFSFPALLPVRQTVRILLKDPYIASPFDEAAGSTTCIRSQNAEYGETDSFNLKPGQSVSDLEAALFKAATVQGYILVRDQEITGLEGVSVRLIHQDGTPYSDFTADKTDQNGFYFLKGILPGTYAVQYTLPDHSLFEDTDLLTIYSAYFTCEQGSATEMPDLYAVRTAQVSGTVTANGAPVSHASVTAHQQETGLIVTVETDPDTGAFDLSLLRPGTYTISTALPQNMVFASDTMLVPSQARSESSVTLELGMGEHLTQQKIMADYPATVSGTVYYDENHSDQFESSEKTLSGFTLKLDNRDGETVSVLTTDEQGHYQSPELVPDKYQVIAELEDDCILVNGYQVSQTEWALDVDLQGGNNTTGDVGILRFGALGGQLWSLDGSVTHSGGLTVALLAQDGDGLPIAETTTDQNGYYAFNRLYPGTYRLTVILPPDYSFARSTDSYTRTSAITERDGGISKPYTLSMGQRMMNVDIGFGAKGSIGDFAWLDENGNGMQDIGEKGIPGIKLALYQGDELIAQTETDVYGHYLFRDIYPGQYTLQVTMFEEIAATVHQTEFPLINSILPQESGLVLETTVIVPSGSTSLSNDIGFMLRQEGVYPSVMESIPSIDWSNGGRKNH